MRGVIALALFIHAGLVGVLVLGGEKPKQAAPLTFPPREGLHLVLPVEAIDGDTVRFYWLVADVGRLNGINAPEMKTKEGPPAKAHLVKLLKLHANSPCKAKVIRREKYGRALVEIYANDNPLEHLLPGDTTLSQMMIGAGHAKPWDGSGKRP
jgi:endonuclease YncB( thermonuclease family)